MRFKRLLSTVLACALTVGLLSLPASAASFTDLNALPEVSEAAEFLRLMGVVTGVPGGAYSPDGTLSRAEFCAMAVRALDREDEEPAQRNRTIYLDVGPTFWATGYINLASIITLGGSDSGTPLVAGVGDGTFQPNRAITYGEAVTILCRMLGYGANDVSTGGAWYDGYLTAGAAAGLTDGLTLGGTDVISRGQAAILFYNLYFSKTKGGKDTYLVAVGGKEVEGGIVLDVKATADDNSPAVMTTKDTYKTDRDFAPSLEGKEGKVILDAEGKLLSFVPKEGTSQRLVNITSALATSLTVDRGEKITIDPKTTVYRGQEETTWASVWQDISSTFSTPVTLHYGANGKLAYLYFASTSVEDVEVLVLRTAPAENTNPFSSLTSGGSYTMYKNGLAATAADIRQYDVATYDASARVIQVSDLKLTGIYEDASPSPSSPTSVTLMGQSFPLLPSAWNDFSSFRIGDRVTLLLTADGMVAGAVGANVVTSDAVGVASVSGTSATVTLLPSGFQVSGQVSSAAKRYDGQLVSVTSGSKERLSLSALSGSAAKADLDVAQRRLGDRDVAENVAVYDRVKNGQAVEVKYSSLTQSTIARSKISFVSYDYAGRVRCMILDDVTGDAYDYGYFHFERGGDGKADTLCVRQAPEGGGKGDSYSDKGTTLASARSGVPGGVALIPGVSGSTSTYRVAATVTLKELSHVTRSAFDSEEMTVTVGASTYPVSDKVQCYNKTTNTWFPSGKEGLEAARAYSDDLTLYYDRAPGEGGKIRMIVVP